MATKAVRGTRDLLPLEVEYFQYIEGQAREVFDAFDYDEIRFPVFESTELFVRGIGEETDIVSKEMYTFNDKKGRSITLRPEGTASVVRALIEHNLISKRPIQKFYYMGPMFRYERPQQGRYRQFYQIGLEFFGVQSPAADAEVIHIASECLSRIGFEDCVTKVNSIGCRKCRPVYTNELKRYLLSISGDLCEDCRRRAEMNPMRVLDCKKEKCLEMLGDVPVVWDFVCEECKTHFDVLKLLLDKQGVRYEVSPRLVRGFDYYTKTVFETSLAGLGSQDTVLGGGRYDNLVEDLGGQPTPAVGLSYGVDRIAIALQSLGKDLDIFPTIDAYFLCLDESLLGDALEFANRARHKGLRVRFDCVARSMKSGLRQANSSGSKCVFLLGENEFNNGTLLVKDLKTGSQQSVPLDKYDEFLRKEFEDLKR